MVNLLDEAGRPRTGMKAASQNRPIPYTSPTSTWAS